MKHFFRTVWGSVLPTVQGPPETPDRPILHRLHIRRPMGTFANTMWGALPIGYAGRIEEQRSRERFKQDGNGYNTIWGRFGGGGRPSHGSKAKSTWLFWYNVETLWGTVTIGSYGRNDLFYPAKLCLNDHEPTQPKPPPWRMQRSRRMWTQAMHNLALGKLGDW